MSNQSTSRKQFCAISHARPGIIFFLKIVVVPGERRASQVYPRYLRSTLLINKIHMYFSFLIEEMLLNNIVRIIMRIDLESNTALCVNF